MEINITLCLQHLERRIREGWLLQRDNGPDNQPCYDCATEGKSLGAHKAPSQQ